MKFLVLVAVMAGFLFASVDINKASVKELMTLKGVGSKKAEAIVKYRKKHCFKKVDDIVKVKGFGKKFLEKNRKNMKAGSCKK